MNSRRLFIAAGVSIAANAALVGVKIALAYISGSVALQADAAHSGSDLIVSLLVMISVWLSRKGKSVFVRIVESLFGFGISAIILITAYYFAVLAGNNYEGKAIGYPIFTLLGLFGCILATDALAQYKITVGEQEGSHALVADGYHSRLDVYSSIAVFAAVFGQWRGIRLDVPVALAVSVMIALLGIELFITTVKVSVSGTRLAQAGFVVVDALKRHNLLPQSGKKVAKIVAWLTVIVLLVWGASAFRTVKPWQNGLMLRFGKLQGKPLDAGLYIAPFPVYELETVNTKEVRTVEVGFRTTSNGVVPLPEEALCTSGDSNIVVVMLSVYYTVSDAARFRFACDEPEKFLKAASEESMRFAVARLPFAEILAEGRESLAKTVKESLEKKVQRFDCGIKLVAVKVREVKPPREVLASFREVFSAQEDLQTSVNRAQSVSNSSLPQARGKAAKIIADAEAYAAERLLMANVLAERLMRIFSVMKSYKLVARLELKRSALMQALENSKSQRLLLDWRLRNVWFVPKSDLSLYPNKGGANAR